MKTLLSLGFALSILCCSACGFQEATYVPYKKPVTDSDVQGATEEEAPPEGDPGEESEATCEEEALAIYSLRIAGAVNGSCHNCHASSNALILASGKDAENRANLFEYTGGDAERLIDKIHQLAGETHSGGSQTGTLGAAPIREWVSAENLCL